MAPKSWKSRDGIEIPLWGSPERKEYDSAFKDQLQNVFGGNTHTLRKLKVPLAQVNQWSGNEPVNKDRLSLYTKMARGGDRLPPVVVRRNPNNTFDMVDGSHRHAAAKASGVKGLDAYELVPKLGAPVKKSEPESNEDYYNYDHLLRPEHTAGAYSLRVTPRVHHDGSSELSASVHHLGNQVGSATGTVHKGVLSMGESKMDPMHRGRGLGMAMCEALYGHAKHGMGVTRVSGFGHDTAAHGVHRKLAEGHGLGYDVLPEVKKTEGKPSKAVNYDSPEFKNWFGASQAVDPHGKPKMFYRGVRRADPKGHLDTMSFTDSPDVANIYAGDPHTMQHTPGSSVIQAHMRMQNPLHLEGVQNSFGNILRKLKYGQPGGISHEEAGRIINHLINRKKAQEVPSWAAKPNQQKLAQMGDFKYGYDDGQDDEDGDLDFSDFSGRTPLHDFKDNFEHLSNPKDALEEADNLKADTFAYVDTPAFTRAAKALGHDVVVHDDALDAADEAGPKLAGKPAHQLEGVTTSKVGAKYSHKTYRPLSATSVKSVYNQGSFDPTNEDLNKMAIEAIPPGEKEEDNAVNSKWNYSHVLPEALHSNYHVEVQHLPASARGKNQDLIRARLFQKHPKLGKERVGVVDGLYHPGTKRFNVQYAQVNKQHQGKGLGLGLYEALYAHARNVLGATHAAGGEHSTLAHVAHTKLARKHGLDYEAERIGEGQEDGDFDDAFGPYSYALKAEGDVIPFPTPPAHLEDHVKAHAKTIRGHDPKVLGARYMELFQTPGLNPLTHIEYRALGRELTRQKYGTLGKLQALLGTVKAEEGDDSFAFGANVPLEPTETPEPPSGIQDALKVIGRMRHPEKRKMAQDWYHYTQGHTHERPQITPDLERHLARYGVVDPQGFDYGTDGRSMAKPIAGKKANGPIGQQPDELKRYKQNSQRSTYYMPYQRSENESFEAALEKTLGWKPPAIAPVAAPPANLGAAPKPPAIAPMAAPKPAPMAAAKPAPSFPGLTAPPAAPAMHSTVEGFMGQLKGLPKEGPARGKFITQHMNHGPFLQALQAHPQGPTMHKQLTGYLNGAANAGFKRGATKAVVKAEDVRRKPVLEQLTLRKALRANKAKKLKKNGNLDDGSAGATMRDHQETASHMLGFKPHMHAAFKAARFMVGAPEASFEAMRRALWQNDGDYVAAALALYGIPDTKASRKALAGHQNVEEMEKGEDTTPKPKHALPIVPAAAQAAAALSRAFEQGSFQTVKLGGKHSGGSMLASDPESGLTFLLKPNAGGVSPAKGVKEETANQARREAAFWHASKLMGLQDYMPQADAVTISMSDGTSSEWACILMLPPKWKPVEEVREKDLNWLMRSLEKYRANGTLHQWGAMDFILGNPDRHWGNALMHDTDIKLIDQGSAFAGADFAPGSDKNSFVPFYLRYSCPTSAFNQLSLEAKLRWMPSVSKDVDEMLRVWMQGIDADVLGAYLRTYGIHPDACMRRLEKLQSVAGSISEWVNRMWAAS